MSQRRKDVLPAHDGGLANSERWSSARLPPPLTELITNSGLPPFHTPLSSLVHRFLRRSRCCSATSLTPRPTSCTSTSSRPACPPPPAPSHHPHPSTVTTPPPNSIRHTGQNTRGHPDSSQHEYEATTDHHACPAFVVFVFLESRDSWSYTLRLPLPCTSRMHAPPLAEPGRSGHV